jgi:hypothetical protein
MGPQSVIRVELCFSMTNNANNKTLRLRFGGTSGLGGTTCLASVETTAVARRISTMIANRGALNSQLITNWIGYGSGNALSTAAIDTETDQDLVVSGLLAVAGDLLTLESFFVEVLNAR